MKMESSKKYLYRDQIKFIAIMAMTLNHGARVFLTPGTFVCELLIGIGYATAITMCYFLVEGFHCTHSQKQYGARLLGFGIVSQLPFMMLEAFAGQKYTWNMLLTLFICYLILWIIENVSDYAMKIGLVIAMFYVSVYADWAVSAPLFTVLFYRSYGDKKATQTAFAASIALVVINDYLDSGNLLFCGLHSVGLIFSAFLILILYNGQRSRFSKTFLKWFFYLYYPVHLVVLDLLGLLYVDPDMVHRVKEQILGFL